MSGKAAAHLALVGENTFRTPWLAAQLLSKDPLAAQDAARTLLVHLNKTTPAARTLFENYLCGTKHLYDNLEEFGRADPPVRLWHARGQFEILFKFLAPRFLLAPDHVLDCERLHARWQWQCAKKRSLKMHSLNALLKVMHYQENNWWPNDEELFPYLQTEKGTERASSSAAADEGVAPQWRSRPRLTTTTLLDPQAPPHPTPPHPLPAPGHPATPSHPHTHPLTHPISS